MSGCSTLNTAKPLSPGEHEVAFTLGGPLTQVGGNYIPLPNSVIEGRSGLVNVGERPLDLNYGLYLTPIAFGQMGTHIGSHFVVPWGFRASSAVFQSQQSATLAV